MKVDNIRKQWLQKKNDKEFWWKWPQNDSNYNNLFEAGTEDYYDYEIGYDDGCFKYLNIGDGWYDDNIWKEQYHTAVLNGQSISEDIF